MSFVSTPIDTCQVNGTVFGGLDQQLALFRASSIHVKRSRGTKRR
jgi:hypothetical protein